MRIWIARAARVFNRGRLGRRMIGMNHQHHGEDSQLAAPVANTSAPLLALLFVAQLIHQRGLAMKSVRALALPGLLFLSACGGSSGGGYGTITLPPALPDPTGVIAMAAG